jgi:hypothetical protein
VPLGESDLSNQAKLIGHGSGNALHEALQPRTLGFEAKIRDVVGAPGEFPYATLEGGVAADVITYTLRDATNLRKLPTGVQFSEPPVRVGLVVLDRLEDQEDAGIIVVAVDADLAHNSRLAADFRRDRQHRRSTHKAPLLDISDFSCRD